MQTMAYTCVYIVGDELIGIEIETKGFLISVHMYNRITVADVRVCLLCSYGVCIT